MKKKLLIFCSAALLLASCGNKASNDATATAEDKAFGDSLSTALGTYAGQNENMNLKRVFESAPEYIKNEFDKKEYMRALELVLTTDTTNIGFLNGLYTGMNLYNSIIGPQREAGIPVDPKLVIKAFKEAFMADSIADPTQAAGQYRALEQRLRQISMDKMNAAKAESPEAKENLKKGEKFAKDKLTEGFSKSSTGLVYKINNPGSGDKVTDTSKIKLKYVGKHIDGTVFDQSAPEGYDSAVNSFIPGFTEGLKMLAKGGSATIVIPTNLAYGINGAGQLIGPNETLVFDIEILDVLPNE
jgi:FKBP-type peptidyl-prolyl cis-trans isomerase